MISDAKPDESGQSFARAFEISDALAIQFENSDVRRRGDDGPSRFFYDPNIFQA